MKLFLQDQTANKWWSQDLNLGRLAPDAMLSCFLRGSLAYFRKIIPGALAGAVGSAPTLGFQFRS